MKRRQFLKSAALVGAGSLLLPRSPLFGANAAGDKLNIALIGTWGRGHAHFNSISSENVVALCDIDKNHLVDAVKKFPNAKTYSDWRKCLEQKDINAVVCCTPDHTHAFIANWAMNRDMHVYCEKPLANSVEEARVVRSTYLKKKGKLATQVGTQRHEHENFNRVRELVRDGAIGELTQVCAWGDRQIRSPGYLPAQGEVPAHLDYDLWIGPSPMHPYNPGYFAGGPGMNCLKWNMYWDFGSGQVGDMGSHTMDLAWNALDAALPTSAQAKGDAYNAEVTPVKLETHFEMPANDWRPAFRLSWYQGGAMPDSPASYVNLNKIGHGAMFEGTKGILVADFTTRLLIPLGGKGDMTYYKPRAKEALIPKMPGFQQEWIKACKGDLKTSVDFDYGSKLIETMLLGLVAYRAGKKVAYDGAAGKITDVAEANEFLRRTYRAGWTLNG